MKKTSIKLDNDTKKLLTEQEKIKSLTEHEGWPLVRSKFLNKVGELLNLSTINILNTATQINYMNEIGMRQMAAARLVEILNDIQGTAEQFDANSALTEEISESYIIRNDVKIPRY